MTIERFFKLGNRCKRVSSKPRDLHFAFFLTCFFSLFNCLSCPSHPKNTYFSTSNAKSIKDSLKDDSGYNLIIKTVFCGKIAFESESQNPRWSSFSKIEILNSARSIWGVLHMFMFIKQKQNWCWISYFWIGTMLNSPQSLCIK